MTRINPLVALLASLLVLGCAGAALGQMMPVDSGATGPLACGWNMVGIPIDGPTAVADCQVRDDAGTTLPMAEAVRAGWLQLPAFTYDGSGYRSCGTEPWHEENAFRPWTGYWILVYRCGIQIVYPIPIRVPCGSGIALKTDLPVYHLCPVCDVIPRPIRMSLAVFNTTCVPVTYDFMTGQEFDFEIRNAEGRLIWRWSDDRAFPLATHSVTLGACCTDAADIACRICIHGYAEFLPFDPTGMMLPEGLYTLKGWLTADKTMEATITFEISYGPHLAG